MSQAITIVIPTFRRVTQMLTRVAELLPQMGSEDRIIIIDNATPQFRCADYHDLQNPNVTVLVNKANVGGNANIVKCFEACGGEWMWLLSDDDFVLPHALEQIRSEITDNPAACFINFTARDMGKSRARSIAVHNLEDFIRENDGFSNTLLMSNNVYRVEVIIRYLRYAYCAVWTNAPHLAPALKALEAGETAVYSCREVVRWNKPNLEEMWAIASVYSLLNLTTVLGSSDHMLRLRRLIIDGLPRPEYFALQICYMIKKYGNQPQALEYAKGILERYRSCGGTSLFIRALLLGGVLSFPSAALLTAGCLYRIFRKKSIEEVVQAKAFHFYL